MIFNTVQSSDYQVNKLSFFKTKCFPEPPTTISNSSTMRGWLESTGLDDILLGTCSCIFREEEPPPTVAGERGRGGTSSGVGSNKRVIKAGKTVDGTPLLIQETSLGLFGIGLAPLYRGSSRYDVGTFVQRI